MGDEVNNMVARFRVGSREGNLEQLVMGMRELLSVLEHMKLDVANHQIRCEQRNFSKKIAPRRLDIARSRRWYRRAQQQYAQEPAEGFGDMSVFFRAVARLVRPSRARGEDAILPETFIHDNDRLLRMRSDVLDAVNIDVCMRLYENLVGVAKTAAYIPTDLPRRLHTRLDASPNALCQRARSQDEGRQPLLVAGGHSPVDIDQHGSSQALGGGGPPHGRRDLPLRRRALLHAPRSRVEAQRSALQPARRPLPGGGSRVPPSSTGGPQQPCSGVQGPERNEPVYRRLGEEDASWQQHAPRLLRVLARRRRDWRQRLGHAAGPRWHLALEGLGGFGVPERLIPRRPADTYGSHNQPAQPPAQPPFLILPLFLISIPRSCLLGVHPRGPKTNSLRSKTASVRKRIIERRSGKGGGQALVASSFPPDFDFSSAWFLIFLQ